MDPRHLAFISLPSLTLTLSILYIHAYWLSFFSSNAQWSHHSPFLQISPSCLSFHAFIFAQNWTKILRPIHYWYLTVQYDDTVSNIYLKLFIGLQNLLLYSLLLKTITITLCSAFAYQANLQLKFVFTLHLILQTKLSIIQLTSLCMSTFQC